MPTLDYTTRLETAFQAEVYPEIQETVFQAHPTISMFLGASMSGSKDFKLSADALKNANASKVVKKLNGNAFEVPITRASMGTSTVGRGSQSITNTAQGFLGKARYELTQLTNGIAIPTDEFLINMAGGTGKQKMVKHLDLMATATEQALNSMLYDMTADLFGTGNDTTAGLLSIYAGVGGTSGLTYAGLDRSTYTTWEGNGASLTASSISDPTDAEDYIIHQMNNMVTTVTGNGALPGNLVFVAGSTPYNAYKKTLMYTAHSTNRGLQGSFVTDNGKGLPSGNVAFGDIPVIYEPNAPSGGLYLIDTASAFFVAVPNAIFHTEDWTWEQSKTNQISRISFLGQFVVTNPRRSFYTVWA